MIQQVEGTPREQPQAESLSISLKERMPSAAFAFRGYNVTNLGRTAELLENPVYQPVLERHLRDGSEICSQAINRPVDLIGRIRRHEETTLETYSEAIAMIASVELAQLEILRDVFDVSFGAAQMALGYSLGEVTALVAAGVYSLESLLTPILSLSGDCVELAQDIRMGIVFSRGPLLDIAAVDRLCIEVTARGQGMIEISTYLSPNTVLVLGQGPSLDMLRDLLKERYPRQVTLKENPHRWPPIHTGIVRQRNIADRASAMLATTPGGLTAPIIPVASCITGGFPYSEFNSRRILSDWVDKPQRLWDVLELVLHSEVDTIIHLGPDPNIIPATMSRICQNVEAQLKDRSLSGLGLRAVSTIVRARPWLAQYISKEASLLRAPQIQHIILEDWLLANAPVSGGK